jgi:hypothetical protein
MAAISFNLMVIVARTPDVRALATPFFKSCFSWQRAESTHNTNQFPPLACDAAHHNVGPPLPSRPV